MNTNFNQVLEKRNKHVRDKHLVFEPKWHKYTVSNDQTPYMSVTKWINSHFPGFNPDAVIKKMMAGPNWNEDNKYWGMSPNEIKKLWNDNGKKSSSAGTALHECIEHFMNQHLENEDGELIKVNHDLLLDSYLEDMEEDDCNIGDNSIEWNFFINYVSNHKEKTPYRTEWKVFDEDLKMAGAIDMIYENEDGTLDIYDWKRVKEINKYNKFESSISNGLSHIPHSNFWHYSLQLNTYKAIIERKYNKKVRNLCLVVFHPEAECQNYQIVDCADMSSEVSLLLNHRLESLNNR